MDRIKNEKGFTLVETAVVLVLLAVTAAVAVPAATRYIRLAEFRKNEANAKTAYLAAESVLTWYRTSGEWEDFCEEIKESGTLNETFPEDDARSGRIYAVLWNNGEAAARSDSEEQAAALLRDCSYDRDFLNAAIAVEVDVETGHAYSAFYATHCQALSYEGTDTDGVLSISARDDNRSYESRRDRLLGYYSAEDVTNVVELRPVPLKVTSINLVNSETLSLNWSSNSRHDNRDVTFHITFYEAQGQTVLFSTQVNRSRLIESRGWTGSAEDQMAGLALKDADGKDLGTWDFPLRYLAGGSGQNGRFSLILDGMMSASLMESLKADPSADYARTSSTSITRLGTARVGEGQPAVPLLQDPQDIYAVIEAEPDYKAMEGDLREYQRSLPVTSNVENTLFAETKMTGSGDEEILEAEISRFRHLSNIRYYEETKRARFTLTGQSIDWTAAGAGLYDGAVDKASPQGVRRLLWQNSLQGEQVLDVPSIPLLSENHTLTGKEGGLLSFWNSGTALSNIRLGEESVPGDKDIDGIYQGRDVRERPYSRYLGLFLEVEGTIENVILQDPVLELMGGEEALEGQEPKPAEDLGHLYGAGILCGRSQGRLQDISVKAGDKNARTVTVCLADREETEGSRDAGPAGIGGLAGVLAARDQDGALVMLTASGSGAGTDPGEALIRGLSMEGTVTARLPKPLGVPDASGTEGGRTPEAEAEGYSYGIGGIFGYAWIGGNTKITDCENHANVTGNLFTGGVGGRVTGDYANPEDSDGYTHCSGLTDCANDGLVLCARTAARREEEGELTGRYFGGILGYGSQVEISGSASASGRASGYRYMKDGYQESERENTLLGQYVGGILGYGNSCHLKGCSTGRGGYILGSDYVGGIAGGLSNNVGQVITGAGTTGSAALTVNAGYVIGNRYVGGIVGKNDGTAETVVRDCVNNGIAAGYDRYIGGIVGYNGEKGVLKSCSGYLSDYDHSIYNMVVKDWQTSGDCVGGLAGYNNGVIRFAREDQAVAVRQVSGIVTGRNFVGGIIGFNDTKGMLDAEYELIGGQIYASGTGAGGAVGLNASVQLLEQSLTVCPVRVTGESCTGGIIGANVVNLKENTEARNFRADNRIGSIDGTAFTGGIMGYHRTYEETQLPAVQPGSEGSALLQYLLAETQEDFQGERLLPGLGEDGLPVRVMASSNRHTLTISNAANDKAHLENANNNIPIRGDVFVGGILGFCEPSSRLVLVNCRNSAGISRLGEGKRISLKAYLKQAGMEQAASQIEDDLTVSMAGGIIGANMEYQIIDHCANSGNMRDFQGIGGIVGFNAGGVFNCGLTDHFGNAELSYIGGIAGLNVSADADTTHTYKDVMGKTWASYASGTIGACTAGAGRTISGRNCVGGITGYNLSGGSLIDNVCQAGVNAAGNNAGGITGINAGEIRAARDDGGTKRTVTGTSGRGIGGLAGRNQQTGVITVTDDGMSGEVTAVGSGVSITGGECVGGIVGINEGTLKAESSLGKAVYLTAQAAEVRALSGYAGGIAGETRGTGGNITRARNRCFRVTANQGAAGGITAVNGAGMSLTGCENLGNVNSDAGRAGGIAAENLGTIEDCCTGGGTKAPVVISSYGADETGAVCAVNQGEIIIGQVSPVGGSVKLTGNAGCAGGAAGVNEGTILGRGTARITAVPEFTLGRSGLAAGGVTGENRGNGFIQGITADGLRFEGFRNYRYLGGIVGRNQSVVVRDENGQPVTGVKDCRFVNGTIQEGSGAVGNCYGGIAGSNSGMLTDCEVKGLTLKITGVYTATSTSTAREKEESAVHAGGVAGKNEENAEIVRCRLGRGEGSQGKASEIRAGNGMAGGIAGYNKGKICLSGDVSTDTWMNGVDSPDSEAAFRAAAARLRANTAGFSADNGFVQWNKEANAELESFLYDTTKNPVVQGRDVALIMTTNGNLGGITAYNAPTGVLDRCATGNWYVNNKSDAIGVGTGGIIGMNESGKDLSLLLNRAFVGRELKTGATDRFAGGVIGNQNNTTSGGWKIQGCINYGTVYCLNTHYSGGILGQWTGTGGTVEKCFNYGNLQTTYHGDWKGASAGIAAQLYHAYENHEYNIISCGNYGNIYGREGKQAADCASDSAGILGNVTAYRVEDNTSGQTYSIQVLDCVNGSGVEIYSDSMASGIVGFFSCDSPDQGPIERSTKNISLRIERCRNYAAVLTGKNFAGGIFGDRYHKDGAENTVLKDCYSVSWGDGKYQQHPIISFENHNSKDNTGDLKASDNYYLDGNKVTHVDGWMYGIDSNLKRAGTARAFLITAGKSEYLAYLKPNMDITASALTIGEDDRLYLDTQGTSEAGQLLCKISGHGSGQHNDMNSQIVNRGSDFDDHIREAYHKLEDAANRIQDAPEVKTGMEAPSGVALLLEGNRVKIHVDPARGTDPFKYRAVLYLGNTVIKEFEFYSEDYSFELSARETALAGGQDLKDLKAAVRACSMFDHVADSASIDSGTQQVARILPDPSLRIELVRQKAGGAMYRFWLDNIEDYGEFQPAADGLADWQIRIGGLSETIKPKWNGASGWERASLYIDSDRAASDSLQQLLVQAVGTGGAILPSGQVSVPVYLPKDKPSMSLTEEKRQDGSVVLYAAPDAVAAGDHLADLRITVTLTASGSGSVSTPPIYRADLIGTWDDGNGTVKKDVVLQTTDILASANGSVSAVFSDLPEELFRLKDNRLPYVTDLKVRVWYAQSGLGPVYTYYSAEGENAGLYELAQGGANICLLDHVETGTAENGTVKVTPVWKTMDSPVLDGGNFRNYCKILPSENTSLFQWIRAPHLAEDAGLSLNAGAEQNRLQYTFFWDQEPGEYTNGTTYIVSLIGINESGSEVSIVTDQEVKGNELSADAEDWTYQKVKLTVTRRGEEGKSIGLTSSGEYTVKQRLPRPAQPNISNPNTNELDHRMEWTPVVPETGCVSYEIYVQPYKEDGTLDAAQPVHTVHVDEKQEDGVYRTVLPLEAYAGKKVLVYLAALPAVDDPLYVRSVDGVTCELEVPGRIAPPVIDCWEKSWEYDPDNPVTAAAFRAEDGTSGGGLRVAVEPSTAPPGDSSYLLKAYVFDSEAHAEAAKEQLKSDRNEELETLDGWLAVYPLQTGSILEPAVMDPVHSLRYEHTLRGLSAEYAGRWILFYARVSSGNGQISSHWVDNPGIWRLPYVKLPGPELQSGSRELAVEAENRVNPDLPEQESWDAVHKTVEWHSVELADTYDLTLQLRSGAAAPLPGHIRIQETGTEGGDGGAERAVKVSMAGADGSWTELTGQKAEDAAVYTFDLEDYFMEVTGSYENADGLTVPYQVTAHAVLEAVWEEGTGFRYTLILPDADRMETADGSTVSGESLRPTASAAVYADVKENGQDPSVQSEAYIRSEESRLDFAD